MTPKTELEAYSILLTMHLSRMVERLEKLEPEHWDWTPDQAAPSSRTLAVHAWQWLQCDRQHILGGDPSEHKDVEEPPLATKELCEKIVEETATWREMLEKLTPEDLDREVLQFGRPDSTINVRGYICHMVQNVIYKHGQISELYFALGYDGKEPYTAPFPNKIYAEVREGNSTAAG